MLCLLKNFFSRKKKRKIRGICENFVEKGNNLYHTKSQNKYIDNIKKLPNYNLPVKGGIKLNYYKHGKVQK